MFGEEGIRSEEFNYLLEILEKKDDDFKKTIIELNKYHHYQLKNLHHFINKLYQLNQFITNHSLYNPQQHFKNHFNLIHPTYTNKTNHNHSTFQQTF